jgi:CubicO group peptidase (beta-lactamase class C family)
MRALADEIFEREMPRMAIPGGVLVVVDAGQPVLTRAWGLADVAHSTPVEANSTSFRIGSLGKTFTALAVLQLVERGVLDLDTPVSTYTPDIEGLDNSVTLRRLLLHTAGFEDRYIGYQSRPNSPFPNLRDHLSARLPRQRPGLLDLPAYSNYGYALAGLAVEEASRTPFRSYVEREIFAPLGMDGSFYAAPPLDERAASLATEYSSSGEVHQRNFTNPYPAGGAAVTATDMERFIIAFLAAYHGEANAIGPVAPLMARTQAAFSPKAWGSG